MEITKNKSKPFIFPYECEINNVETVCENGKDFVKTHKNFAVKGSYEGAGVKLNIKINASVNLSLNWLSQLIKLSLNKNEIEQLKSMI